MVEPASPAAGIDIRGDYAVNRPSPCVGSRFISEHASLEERMSSAWIAVARRGAPGATTLPVPLP